MSSIESLGNEALKEIGKEYITYGKEIVLPINERSIKIKKLGLLSLTKMTSSLKGIISAVLDFFDAQDSLKEIETTDGEKKSAQEKNSDFSLVIATLVEQNILQVISLLDSAVPDLGREYIESEIGLDDAIVLLDAVIKVNNINKVIIEGKKLFQDLMTRQV